MKSITYSVSGTHCHACEILIEKEVGKLRGVKSVEASSSRGDVTIQYQKGRPSLDKINEILKTSGYVFFEGKATSIPSSFTDYLKSFFIALAIILVLYFLNTSGLLSFNVNSDSALPAFILFGLLAGFSSCAALVGGIILSLTRQWQSLYSRSDSLLTRLRPALMFNFGRFVFFGIFGAVLGYFGSFFHLSLSAGAIISILVSILMLILGLQMLGIAGFQGFQFALPKTLTGRFANEQNFQGKYMPVIMGALTFFLPCGFTLTTQSLALASGSPVTGALIMALFALGTFVPLLLIAWGGTVSKSKYFSYIAGILVIIFALYTANAQLAVLDLPNISFAASSNPASVPIADDLVPVVNGQQILIMDASSTGYSPNFFKIKAGLPVRWEITDRGTSGCTNAVLARSLFDGVINLVPGTTSVKEFTAPATPGTYRFSCWMGMISGSIEVVN
jgi:sulfite exporter TauE/SafE/copper chaperone CopZ/plastocyanin